ncbi:glycosyltransferase family protein [Mucilaginibacter myungsuensis]|uniref:Glycosyltransferase involved in cell wall biosynthesis n=1 Tax=Mucilaginibacter myungsuensis TaxID=649104 RepID=A0A929PU55_9SPHI|nr:hypothetical protein [Mucilaginibacter myungsuensis]MBE9660393.1 hypothetical protein [Mucilaginibacter myungsuensis]MDN3600435.1 hypothetical protein [Mucilaginibacter myungsuensis]
MKIGFICGSLEEGKDGVGDYVRKFSSELIRMGHQVVIAAINDQHITMPFTGVQQFTNVDIPVLRLPSVEHIDNKIAVLKTWMTAFGPDRLSLQFVPFSFDKRGLTFSLGKKLRSAFPAANWHIMFHELWVGMKSDSSFKLRAWGTLQKLLIQNMISVLQPTKMHTQTHLYQAQLWDAGYTASLLPLFGNIPLIKDSQTDIVDSKQINLVHFGSIYPNAPIVQFAADMAQYSKKADVLVTLNIIGRSGPEKADWMAQFKSHGLTVNDLGERNVDEIAELFSKADLGIATTACALIEKSGSVAAMREFGLPVICVAAPWRPDKKFRIKNMTDVFEYQENNLDDFMYNRHHSPYIINVSVVANLFINALVDSHQLNPELS